MTPEDAKAEIEKGVSAVKMAVGGPTAPFFRFPALRHPPELVTYMGERNIGIFSTDMDSFDFTMRTPERSSKEIMTKLEKHGKGIVLMHDFQQSHRRGRSRIAQAAEGRRLQDRAYARQGPVEHRSRCMTRC